MIKLESTQNLLRLKRPITTLKDQGVAEIIEKMTNLFFGEIDLYLTQNEDLDFLSYFLERTYLSMFVNGIIRADVDRLITCAQEYSIIHSNGSFGRCDTFLNYNRQVFYIEAKLQQYSGRVPDDHWNIESWMNWDNDVVRLQALKYVESETKSLNPNIYSNCYVMTLIFKVLKEESPSKYFEIAEGKLPVNHINSLGRDWFYSVAFMNDKNVDLNGLEVYGTIEKYK